MLDNDFNTKQNRYIYVSCDDDEKFAINMKAEEKKLKGMIGENVQCSNTLLLSVETDKKQI